MDAESESKKLKKIAIRNTRSTLLAYAVPMLGYSAIVSYAGLSSTPYLTYVYIYLACVAFILASIAVIKSLKTFTHGMGNPLLVSQLVFWVIAYHAWLFTLEEGRAGGLLFALTMLVYTFAYGTFKLAVILNTLIVVGYLGVNYVGMEYYGQPGNVMKLLVALTAYLPVSIMVGRVGSKLAKKKHFMNNLLEKQTMIQQQLQETLIKLDQAANTDELTGMINRREINRLLDYEYQQLQRTHVPTCIAILDLDHFKRINDTYGHNCGDHVLVTVADVLKKEFRATDSVARWGGEEFIVLMPNTSQEEAKDVLERVLNKLADTKIRYDRHMLNVTCSAGLCEMDIQAGVSDTLNTADDGLYNAKNAGRNQVCIAQMQLLMK